ncbi:MAG: isomerase [Candidatus Hydrogenedentota bacterium]|nr:MAG: isomerase [Candidatus Hydrogenedentota bacterium]
MNLLLWTGAADESHFDLVKDISKWGFDGVEFPIFTPDCSPWKDYSALLADLDMGCTAVSVLPEDTSLVSEDAAVRQAAQDHLRGALDSCVAVGAETMVGPIFHPVGALIGRGPTEDEHKRLADELIKLADYTKDSGVAISVEPLNRFETYVLNSQSDTRAVIDAVGSPLVGQLYDSFHANIEEKSLSDAINAGGDKINHVHISANDRATPGEDHVDWDTTFSGLKGIGYDGWLTIEAFGSWIPDLAGATCIWRKMAPSEEHLATEGLKFVRESWAKA